MIDTLFWFSETYDKTVLVKEYIFEGSCRIIVHTHTILWILSRMQILYVSSIMI